MARILVGRDTLARGDFPSVCCKTGRHAELYNVWEFSDTPGWTWILLLFGIFPFLIATAFATERFRGVLPISIRSQTRLNTARRFVWVFGIAAVVCGVLGITSTVRPLLPIAAAFAAVWLIAIFVTWIWSPTANLDHGAVALSRVHPAFVDAVKHALPSTPAGPADEDTDPGPAA